MKKLFTLALAVLMIATLAVTVSADGNNAGLTYSAPYGNITVDGTIEAAWDNAKWENIVNGRAAAEPNGGKFKLMHDDKYLYLLGQLDDPTGLDMLMNENFTVVLHLDGCDKVIAKECASSHAYILNRKNALEGVLQCWDNIINAMTSATEDDVVYYTIAEEGNLITWEARFEIPDAIAAGLVMVDVLCNDYGAYDEYIPGNTWNTYGANPEEPGTIYLLSADGTSPVPVETEPVETEPVETEPVETEPVETEPVETEPAETEPKETESAETKEADTPAEESSFPVAPVVIAVIVVLALAVVGVVLAKKKK